MCGVRELLAVAIGVALAGCQSAFLQYRPVRTLGTDDDGNAVETRNFIPADIEDGVGIRMSGSAFERETEEGVDVPFLGVRIAIENRSDTRPFEVVRPGTHVQDDEGHRLDVTAMEVDDTRTEVVTVPPGSQATLDLFFEAPSGYDLARVASFRLFWTFRFGGRVVHHETKLNLVVPQYTGRPYDPWGPLDRPYGYPGWYDPWYCDPWGPPPPRGPTISVGLRYEAHVHTFR